LVIERDGEGPEGDPEPQKKVSKWD
jgi:hypothetical protein